jgi:Phosphoribosylaminoimidazole (AIR) synthetase
MFNTFNMGTGMVLVVDKNDADKAKDVLLKAGHAPRIIGEITAGDAGVELL